MSQIEISLQTSLSEDLNLSDPFKVTELKNSSQTEESLLMSENQHLETQIKQLQFLLMQYQLTNQKMNEKIHENKILQDSVNTLELNINCLNEIIEIQSIELSRQDSTITECTKEILSHEEKFDVLAFEFQENDFPVCSKCSKSTSRFAKCEMLSCCEQDISCVLCGLNIYSNINNENEQKSPIQSPSKKIQKLPKNHNQNKFRKAKRDQRIHSHSHKSGAPSHNF